MAIIAKKKLSEKVVDEIRKRMESGELKIGDKLPNQNELSKELGVSRTSLREAMNILDLLGVIEQKPGFGTAIRKHIPQINPEGLKPTLLSDGKTTKELLAARKIIESGAVYLAAENATERQIAELEAMVHRMQTMFEKKDYPGYGQVDLKFHTRLAELSKNRFIKEAFVSIKQHMELFIQEHTLFLHDVLEKSQLHHRNICKAISQGNPERARKEMETHITFLQGSHKNYKKRPK
ncbi:MAG: FadR family transcriptional regulator [Desulfobacterales bacterium]|nr:FadR family transcriptional regulator [Desulfobacterales bacterium]